MYARIALGVCVGAVLGSLMGYFGKCEGGACPLTANPWRGAAWGAVLGALATSV